MKLLPLVLKAGPGPPGGVGEAAEERGTPFSDSMEAQDEDAAEL